MVRVEEIKRCRKCGEEFPRTIDYFKKDKNSKDGLYGQCRSCVSKRSKAYDDANKEHKKEYSKRYRQDHKEERQAYQVQYRKDNRESYLNNAKQYRENTKEHRSEYNRQYAIDHKEERNIKWKIYYRKNKESRLEYQRVYRFKNKEMVSRKRRDYKQKNKDKIARAGKLYREANRERISEWNKQYSHEHKIERTEYAKRYRMQNPERHRIAGHNRRVKIRSLPRTFTIKQWENAKLYFDNKCAFCGEEKPLTLDHFVAVDNGGEFTRDNVIPSCQSCNSSKWKHDCMVWFRKQLTYTKEKEAKILKYLGYKNGKQQLSIF